MRKILLLGFIPFLLIGCSKTELDYSMFDDQHITWNEIFSIESNAYDVYFYSTSCLHCHSIKDEVLAFAKKHKDTFYFVKESSQFVFGKNIEDTIGVTLLEDFYVAGVPTLVHFSFHIVCSHLLGESQIKNYIETFPF